jgi:phosphoribosylformimino-5-aminoimidazole carboxamide ribotide isomerase
MQVIPVIDLMGGVVVRGIAGRRAEYRPIVSQLTDSTDPVDLARAFHDRLGLTDLYLADLDAIGGAPPAFSAYASIRALGCRLSVDAGVRELSQAQRLAGSGINRIIIGLETIAGPAELGRMVSALGSERIVFSLDLREGQPLGEVSAWETADAEAIARRAVAVGVRAMIVLDLARVGVGAGLGTEELCRRLHQAFPDVELIAGGGVRSMEDLQRLAECGVQAALVASALHDGWIGEAEISRLHRGVSC